AKTDDIGHDNVRRAVIIGSVMASFNIEDFSLERMKTLKLKEAIERFEVVRSFSRFEGLLAHHLS
ncbi:MAG: sugar kinase, partial [Candidatus Margulisbacteria bacterium]|nr:sugar kinase [Candidatus Margulisiibacteriota bacterium]